MPLIMRIDVRMAFMKMSLNELSEKTGLTIQTLSLLKNGKMAGVRFSTIESLCRVLECTPNDLFEYKPSTE